MSVQPKRWTREEYERLVVLGALGPDDRVQLIDGEIVEMAPQGPGHMTAVTLAAEALRRVFLPDHSVRVQGPLALGAFSEPEPDVAVVAGDPRDYRDRHPDTAVLVVEVAEATLPFDRRRKAPIYAAAGIPEYWVVDLAGRALEVYRDPVPPDGRPPAYRSVQRLGSDDHVVPLARPGGSIAVADLLP
jgi:Uma2 family endonuclease